MPVRSEVMGKPAGTDDSVLQTADFMKKKPMTEKLCQSCPGLH
jgi:hypothetical protein